jgi:hypothetical protein
MSEFLFRESSIISSDFRQPSLSDMCVVLHSSQPPVATILNTVIIRTCAAYREMPDNYRKKT